MCQAVNKFQNFCMPDFLVFFVWEGGGGYGMPVGTTGEEGGGEECETHSPCFFQSSGDGWEGGMERKSCLSLSLFSLPPH